MASDLPRESGFLERDGERIRYECIGARQRGPSGRTFVLSHGAGGNHAVWYQQVPFLAQYGRVIAWDQRGFGRSSAIGGATTPALAAADLLALLDHLDVGQADLVGQSMGGWASLRLALDQPARVRKLVLANTPGGIATPELDLAWQGLGAGFLASEAVGRSPALAADFADRELERAYLYQLLGGFGEPDLAQVAPGMVTTRVERKELVQLRCPVLFVTGDRDTVFPPALIRATAALVPGARLEEIAGSGHSPYFEDPDAWNRVVAGFLGLA
jgi:pimeloyl-ACP methyl ester carboxylesterase